MINKYNSLETKIDHLWSIMSDTSKKHFRLMRFKTQEAMIREEEGYESLSIDSIHIICNALQVKSERYWKEYKNGN